MTDKHFDSLLDELAVQSAEKHYQGKAAAPSFNDLRAKYEKIAPQIKGLLKLVQPADPSNVSSLALALLNLLDVANTVIPRAG